MCMFEESNWCQRLCLMLILEVDSRFIGHIGNILSEDGTVWYRNMADGCIIEQWLFDGDKYNNSEEKHRDESN
jgi:hypothetical protein